MIRISNRQILRFPSKNFGFIHGFVVSTNAFTEEDRQDIEQSLTESFGESRMINPDGIWMIDTNRNMLTIRFNDEEVMIFFKLKYTDG